MADNGRFRRFLNMFAFIGIIAVAIAMLISLIFGGNGVSKAFDLVANIIAYVVTAFYGFYYVKSRRNAFLTIVYVIAIITIVVLVYLGAK